MSIRTKEDLLERDSKFKSSYVQDEGLSKSTEIMFQSVIENNSVNILSKNYTKA
jgi:hypothetical protein